MLFCKLLGCALLVLAGAAAGGKRAEATAQRARYLAAMGGFLGEVDAALQYSPQPTAHLLAQAQHSAGLALHFEALRDGPQLPADIGRALEEARAEHGAVPAREWEQFAAAVQRVGQVDAPQARQAISYASQHLERAAREAAEQAQKDRKLYYTLGLSAGAAAALLLV